MSAFDVVVIGAGIQGAGVAQAAAAAGYSVRVLEQSTVAAGTSSRSSKLIHGGLRYLETGQLGLVRECLVERRRLLRLAPDLVRMQYFHIPVYASSCRTVAYVRLGLSTYAMLAGWSQEARFGTIPSRDWGDLDGLEVGGLKKVFRYQDAQTDDVQLTRAVIQSARTLGATVFEGARVTRAELGDDAVTVEYRQGGEPRSCRCSVLVNAAGPWVNQVLDIVRPKVEKLPVDLVAGTHIVVPGRLTHGMYYVEAPRDKRAVFVMPWGNHSLIGTTETVYSGDPADVKPSQAEVDYLLETFHHYFPGRAASSGSGILEAFAGLRVLPAGPGTAFTRPRDTVLHTGTRGQNRLITIYGGKLTAYRLTAQKVLAALKHVLPSRVVVGDTARLPLTVPGGSDNKGVS